MKEVSQKKKDAFIHRVLHRLEFTIALLTLAVLVFMLGLEVYRMFTEAGYFATLDTFLTHVLTIVVGLEFVRMLVDLTPANTIEVLIVAMARQVILSHHDPVANLLSIACIAGLFATRRFLIPRASMQVDLSEAE